MSILSIPIVADVVARRMARSPARVAPELSFPEIGGRHRPLAVTTRHGDVPCTLYLPEPTRRKPAIHINMHGGGYVVRGAEQDDPLCRYLAAKAGVAVLNVDYDVAPTARFPVPVEEVYDIVTWAAARSDEWDGNRLTVGGQSSGAGLANAASRLSMEIGKPKIALQVLHYPPLNLVIPAREKRPPTGKSVILPWMGEVFDTAYAPNPETRKDRLISPGWGPNAEADISRLPPTVLITCTRDLLHDEGAAFAKVLEKAGVLAEYIVVPDADHAYNVAGGTREQAERTYDLIVGHIRRATGQV